MILCHHFLVHSSHRMTAQRTPNQGTRQLIPRLSLGLNIAQVQINQCRSLGVWVWCGCVLGFPMVFDYHACRSGNSKSYTVATLTLSNMTSFSTVKTRRKLGNPTSTWSVKMPLAISPSVRQVVACLTFP